MTERIWLLIGLSVLSPVTLAQVGEVDAGAQIEPDIEILFKGSIAAAESGRLEDAIQAMERVRVVVPNDSTVLWNLGLWYAELQDHESALEMWEQCRRVDSGDWQVRAKLIQAYQALGEIELRDREREALLSWYDLATDEERSKIDLFCREQFTVGGTKVMAFEFFEPSGDRRVYLRFTILDADGNEDYRYSLGSYGTTTLIARETGQIEQDERLYHLDRYDSRSHATLAFYGEQPDYEAVRKSVVRALQGELDEIGSSTP
jgi:tetratricopeptide (TPR) repeat protein